ncbi:MAG: cobyric acid synthase [bacterium]
MAKALMLQGTGSGVGKSLLCAGLCRLLARRGVRVAPFKAQNMALNSGVTRSGEEMGRAQVLQAQAAGLEPDVRMNPILLKPQGQGRSQLVRLGKAIGSYAYRDYYQLAEENFTIVRKVYDDLSRDFELLILEGAGSPAEINLQQTDLSNMRMAHHANARVLLVGDIDHGGVFAWLKGTYDLIQAEYRPLLYGCLINKFRGDYTLLEPGIRLFEKQVPLPVLGTIPYDSFQVDEEDSQQIRSTHREDASLRIHVVHSPQLSNFTDFAPLQRQTDISLEYVEQPSSGRMPDVLILPGSKNTLSDLQTLRERGWADWIQRHLGGFLLVGICGGFQMLGEWITDPQGIEGTIDGTSGLGILPLRTEMLDTKILQRAEYEGQEILKGCRVSGYEIHAGRSQLQQAKWVDLVEPSGLCVWDEKQKILGTYLHGIFDKGEVANRLLQLTGKKIKPIPDHAQENLRELDRLADLIERHCNLSRILDGLC